MWKDKDGKVAQGWIILEVPIEHKEEKEDGTIETTIVPTLMRIFNPSDEQYIQAGYHQEQPAPPQPDLEYERRYQEYLAACEQFRTVCGMIKEFAGLEKFTGGFDEAMEFIQSAPFMANMVQGTYLFSLWQGADKAATYAADKVGFGQPEWWYDCWQQEVVPEPQEELSIEEPEEPVEEPVEVADVDESALPEPPIEDITSDTPNIANQDE